MKSAQAAAVFGILTFFLIGCGKENSTRPEPTINQDTPRDVLESLEGCYTHQDLDGYSALLAEDFQFHLEPGRREELRIDPFWNRASDIAGTGRLLDGSGVADVRISLEFDDPEPVNEIGRESWLSITVLDTFVEVDFNPRFFEPEGVTFRVDGDEQVFYFRKGKNPEDTDPASPTAEKYFLVEWRDFGKAYAPSPTPVEPVTWSTLKTLER